MRNLLTYLILLFYCAIYAEETIVVGTVIDATTGQPIENANVWYKNTNIGCATNHEGLFMVRTNLDKKRTLVVSALGYRSQTFKIEVGQYAGIEVALNEESTALQDLFVVPGANPALELMERVRTNRHENSNKSNSSADYAQLTKKELYISQINQNHLRRLIWKNLKEGMIQTEDSTLVLPLYLSQTKTRTIAGRKSTVEPPQERSMIMTETDYSLLLEGLPEHLNFYNNNINIFSYNFISPLAASGNNHYRYYLADSTLTDSLGKAYIVHFRSKNPYEPSFNGEMTIDSLTCGIRQISATVPREVGVNFLTSLTFNQSYDRQLLPQKEDLSMIFDFAIKADSSHFFPTALLHRQTTTVQVYPSLSGNDTTLANIQYTPISEEVDSAMLKLENSPIIRIAKFIAHIFNTGNIPTGEKVEIGNVSEIIGLRKHEGLHLGVPLTTNERFSKRIELSGYVAYGFHDRALKGKGQIRLLLPTERRHLIGAKYEDHYVRSDISDTYSLLRENNVFSATQDLAYLLFSGINYHNITTNTATRRREFTLWTENDWTNNIETQFAIRIGRMGYGSPFVGYFNIPSYRFRTLQATLRVGFDERKVDIFMRRYHAHSSKPILRFMAEAGSWQLDEAIGVKERYSNQSNLYARLTVQLQQTLPLGVVGKLDYTVQAGIVIGQVPYPLLEHFVGNQTYTYDPYRFTLMNSYQYVADRYIYAHLHWNMQGAIFNRIPYIQRLHLKELVELKFAYGSLSDKHQDVIALPNCMQTMRVPYAEAGIGIGNILRVADLYAIFRLSNIKDTTTPWWAIRFRFSLGL